MILDSNILIGYLNGDTRIVSSIQAWRLSGKIFFVSYVSVVEVLSLPSLTESQIAGIEDFLSDFILIQLDMKICRRAGELRRVNKLETPDAIILASAIANSLPLVTRDKRMRGVDGVTLVDI